MNDLFRVGVGGLGRILIGKIQLYGFTGLQIYIDLEAFLSGSIY